jgi:hypothetical protein
VDCGYDSNTNEVKVITNAHIKMDATEPIVFTRNECYSQSIVEVAGANEITILAIEGV